MRTKNNIAWIFIFALSAYATSVFADEPLWTAQQVHPEAGQDEWVIHPAAEPEKAICLADALKGIYQKDQQPIIRHVAFGSLFKRADLQADVVVSLQKQEDFKKTPPPYGKNKWDFENSGKLQKLVSDALLQSKFAESLNKDLAAYEWKITSVSIEKLYFTKENDKLVWHAIAWLNLAKREKLPKEVEKH
jgi:hypothetical protein